MCLKELTYFPAAPRECALSALPKVQQSPPPFRMVNLGPAYTPSRKAQQKIEFDADLEQILIQWLTAQCRRDVGWHQPGRENFQN